VIRYEEDADRRQASWLVWMESRTLPGPLRSLAAFGPAPAPDRLGSFEAPAPLLALPAPAVEDATESLEEGTRHIHARIRAARGGGLALAFPAGSPLESLSFAGRGVVIHGEKYTRTFAVRTYECLTVPPEGVELDLTASTDGRLEFTLKETTGGLPEEGRRLLAARPETVVTSWNGNATVVTRRVRL